VVLYRVVGSAWKQLRNLGPLVSQRGMCLEDRSILILRPRVLVDARMQMVVPPFSALFANPALQMAGNERPPLWSMLVYKFNYLIILLKAEKREKRNPEMGRERCVERMRKEREVRGSTHWKGPDVAGDGAPQGWEWMRKGRSRSRRRRCMRFWYG
jgi:hypothetical protein